MKIYVHAYLAGICGQAETNKAIHNYMIFPQIVIPFKYKNLKEENEKKKEIMYSILFSYGDT